MTNLEKRSIKEVMQGMSREDLEEMIIHIDDEYLFAEIERRYALMKDKLQSVGAVLNKDGD